MKLQKLTPENLNEQTLFCSKNPKKPEFKAKAKWFNEQYLNGLTMLIGRDADEKAIAYIEFTPAEFAWRPVHAPGYLFIHCMYTYSKNDREKGYASQLIQACIQEAKNQGKKGVAVFTSTGAWMADRRVFEKNGFEEVDKRGRFDLLQLKLDASAPDSQFIPWENQASKYHGWHILYSDQCPWHSKSAIDLQKVAQQEGIHLEINKIQNHIDAQSAPSGFGGFNLVYNGELLEDHYLSGTRFRNILKKLS